MIVCKYLYLSTFLGILFFLAACSGDKAASQAPTGKFLMEIDGAAWIPSQEYSFWFKNNGQNRLSLKAHDEVNGFVIELSLDSEKLKDTHTFSSTSSTIKNRLMLNIVEQDLLNVFATNFCKASKGSVTITRYDERKKTLSGHFEAKLCTGASFGAPAQDKWVRGNFTEVTYQVVE